VPPYRRRTPTGPRSSPTPWRPTSRSESGIPPDIRLALSCLSKYWFTLAVVVFLIVRAILRRGESPEISSAGEAGGGLSLGLAGLPSAGSRGDDPLARMAALRLELPARPTDRSLRLELAQLLLDSGRYRDAIAFLRESVGLAPNDATLHLRLGEALSGACAWDEALAEIAAAIRIEPTLAEAHEARGDVLAEKHWAPSGEIAAPAVASWTEASRLYEKQLAADPGNARLRPQLGGVLVDAGEREAAAGFREVITEAPISSHAFCGLGEALLQLQKTADARKALARALELRPGWARPAGLLRQLPRA
jgi:tetratricopeptide (TPR) repeat protein